MKNNVEDSVKVFSKNQIFPVNPGIKPGFDSQAEFNYVSRFKMGPASQQRKDISLKNMLIAREHKHQLRVKLKFITLRGA